MLDLNDLLKEYPALFNNQQQWKFQCESGWYYLLDGLLACIEQRLRRLEAILGPDQKHKLLIIITQIKEKYGALEFSWTYLVDPYKNFPASEFPKFKETIDEITGAVRLAERLSQNICELCGNPGSMSKMDTSWAKDWKRILCLDCDLLKGEPENDQMG